MDIKILGIAGSPVKKGNAEAYLAEALKAAEACGNVTTELVSLAGKEIRECKHCNWCVTKQSEGKFCNQSDEMLELYPKLLEADGLLFCTPVYTTRLSGYLANFLDRCRIFAHGNYYKGKMINKVGGALAVSWYRHLGGEEALLTIVTAYLVNGIIPVAPHIGLGAPAGAVGLSSEHGSGAFNPKERLGVLKDEYGLTGARNLGQRVVEVARLMKAGREAVKGEAAKVA